MTANAESPPKRPLEGDTFAERLESAMDGRQWVWLLENAGLNWDRLSRIRNGSKPYFVEVIAIANATGRTLDEFV